MTNSAAKTSRSPTRSLCGTPDCGENAEARLDGDAVTDAGDARAATQVAGHVADAVAADERARPLAGGPVAGAVEPVAPHPEFLAATRRARRRWSRPRRAGRRTRSRRARRAGCPAGRARKDRIAATYGGLCAGREERELLHRGQHLVVDQTRAAERAGVDRLEADGGEIAQPAERTARSGELVGAAADGGVVVGAVRAGLADALDAPVGEDADAASSKRRNLKDVLPMLATRMLTIDLILNEFNQTSQTGHSWPDLADIRVLPGAAEHDDDRTISSTSGTL